MIRIGTVRELVRYPVKSMAGIKAESAALGWHGFAGDRRFAFRRLEDRSGFPWLSASRLPELILYRPEGLEESTGEPLPTHVRTPSGDTLELRSDALRSEIAGRFGAEVELMALRNGIFDDAYVSLISFATIAGVCADAGVEVDSRRFRDNVVVEASNAEPFGEDSWVGGNIVFSGTGDPVVVSVTASDVRCMMVNLDPDCAKQDARVMKAVVQRNQNLAGVYGSPVRTGTIHVGQEVWFEAADRGRGNPA